MVKKGSALVVLALLLSLPGCGKRKKKIDRKSKTEQMAKRTDVFSQVEIPLAQAHDMKDSDTSVVSFFDEGLNEFVDMAEQPELVAQNGTPADMSRDIKTDDFAWIEATNEQAEEFKKIYFDFDRHIVRPDQKKIVEQDAARARQALTELAQGTAVPTILIEGHADHAAGSSTYNLALSEQRAQAVAEYLVSNGVSPDNIKIIGRGQAVPEVRNGIPISGSIQEQWPNRRVEIHLLNS